jgi:hypothetical protein
MENFIYAILCIIIGIIFTSWDTVKGAFLFKLKKTESRGWKIFRILSGIYLWLYLGWAIYNLIIWL